jgi:hypothetical protein
MRVLGFIVLVVCLLGAATAADAATSAVGGCQCFGGEQGFAMQAPRWAYGAQRPRQVYRGQRRPVVVVRRAPYQQAQAQWLLRPQAPRYAYGGAQTAQRSAVWYRAYRAQHPRAREAYRGQARPVVAAQPTRAVVAAQQARPAVAAQSASQQKAPEARFAFGTGAIIQHPAGCPVRLFCGCGASIEAFGRSIRDLWLVSNWYRFPRAEPAAGRAVLWGTRHVAIIRQYYGDGTATLYDANSGHGLTRIHRIRIAGLAVVDPHPGGTSAPTPSSLMLIL